MATLLDRYAAVFGGRNALLLRLSGFVGLEVEAAGAWVRDVDGRRWLDFGSFGVHLLGHRHPAVVAAAKGQLDRMGLATKVLGNAAAVESAERLCATLPDRLDRVLFANSGAEAVDMALKLAMLSTGRRRFVALRHSYHGKTLGALSLSDAMRHCHDVGAGHPVQFVDAGDTAAVADALAGGDVAAVVVEPIQGEGGIRIVEPAFLAAVESLCRVSGTLFVLDEIQTGLGRCGEVWRSAGRHCTPDIVLAGKTLGGGLVPVAACVYATGAISETAGDPVLLASSFAGGALAAAVADTVVGLVSEADFLAEVRRKGVDTLGALRSALAGLDEVVEVRGEGLMVGVEMAEPGLVGQSVVAAAERGVLTTFCLHDPRVLRVYPPECCSDEELDEGINRVADAIRGTVAPQLTLFGG